MLSILKVLANSEDHLLKRIKLKFGEEDVDRIRRATRNDVENILPFFTIGFLYLFTNPSPLIAINLFRAAAIARILHTFVYAVYVVPQPARAITWLVCLSITIFMSFSTLLHFL